jgi:hypothetical protein
MIIKLSWLHKLSRIRWERWVWVIALVIALCGTVWAYRTDTIVAYGDAESHLNIAKRVVSSLTPGLAQLGGIWLPLPHLLMLPFVYFDFMWRSGLAGSIVSGASFVAAAYYIWRLTFLLTKNRAAAFFGFMVFVTNPNMIYMQANPMTELPLVAFFVISSYYFIEYLTDDRKVYSLVAAGVFGLGATLSRYDGWFLVGMEAAVIGIINFKKALLPLTEKGEGHMFLYITPAFAGIVCWLLWGWLILGNPLYFTDSPFSAKSQQQGWLARGELPAYHNPVLSVLYYAVVSMSNIGLILTGVCIAGIRAYLSDSRDRQKLWVALLLFVPFVFYVITLFLGQSVIFTPQLTPVTFEWRLFNVRYGLMMIPAAAFFIAYLFARSKWPTRVLLIVLMFLQLGLYFVGYSKVTTFEDGTVGLSSAKRPDAERWMAQNYDSGLVLLDDYSRQLSVIRAKIPMQSIIYIGNKPYWDDAMTHPQDFVRWIVIQKGDTIWRTFYDTQEKQDFLYTYYHKAYTSDEILIFERTGDQI